MYQMFVGDELHEWSLGTWKATFTHLIRILHAVDISLVHKLDGRFLLSQMLLYLLTDIAGTANANVWT